MFLFFIRVYFLLIQVTLWLIKVIATTWLIFVNSYIIICLTTFFRFTIRLFLTYFPRLFLTYFPSLLSCFLQFYTFSSPSCLFATTHFCVCIFSLRIYPLLFSHVSPLVSSFQIYSLLIYFLLCFTPQVSFVVENILFPLQFQPSYHIATGSTPSTCLILSKMKFDHFVIQSHALLISRERESVENLWTLIFSLILIFFETFSLRVCCHFLVSVPQFYIYIQLNSLLLSNRFMPTCCLTCLYKNPHAGKYHPWSMRGYTHAQRTCREIPPVVNVCFSTLTSVQ